MKYFKSYFSILCIASLFVLVHTSCEKDVLNDNQIQDKTLDATLTKETTTNPDLTEVIFLDQYLLKTNDDSVTKSSRVLIHSETNSVNANQWAGYWFTRANLLSPDLYKYEVEVTPLSGDPDLYIYGYQSNTQTWRYIRKSINDIGIMDHSSFRQSGIKEEENYAYVGVKGYTNASFRINVYRSSVSCQEYPPVTICYETLQYPAPQYCGCDGKTYVGGCAAFYAGITSVANGACGGSTECIDPSIITGNPCFAVWEPVCGCDGNTYSNGCYATEAGVSSFTQGTCGGNNSNYASFPYYETFSNGLNQYWSTQSSTSVGRIITANSYYPYSGNYLQMDVSNSGNWNKNQADLHIDLSSGQLVDLNFKFKDYDDEFQASDGIYFSNNGGTSFTKVYSINADNYTDNTWYSFSLPVEILAEQHNLTLTNQFVIRFQQYDNYRANSDGFVFDNIEVVPAVLLDNRNENALKIQEQNLSLESKLDDLTEVE